MNQTDEKKKTKKQYTSSATLLFLSGKSDALNTVIIARKQRTKKKIEEKNE